MRQRSKKQHSVDSLFSLLLFAVFVVFLLLLLLFSAQTYRASVRGLEENNNLRTAAAYITTKFRQHDRDGNIFPGDFRGIPALCFRETIQDKEYTTYLYLQDNTLKELFTASGSDADPEMGTPIARLNSFSCEVQEEAFYRISMEDTEGRTSSFLLHAGPPGK